MNLFARPKATAPVDLLIRVTAAYVRDDAEWHEWPLARVAWWYWLRWLKAKGLA